MTDTQYQRELAELSSHTHGRNAVLVRLALLGLSAGRDAATLKDDIIRAGGEPRLTDSEVERAIRKAMLKFSADRPNFASVNPHRTTVFRPAAIPPRVPNTRETGFVREMIACGNGAKSGDLMALSHIKLADANKSVAFLETLFKPGELVFAGTPQMPRTRENLKTREEWIALLGKGGAVLPTHIVPNPFTGEAGRNSEGKESYCLDSTVAHRRMALVEFDELTLQDQAAFWMGAIRKQLLPVRSLVYSGGKSIHGLIELKEGGEGESWEGQWRTLERLLCSDADAAYRADRACKNPSRFTRFPGAVRPETGHRQVLLYLA